MQHNIAIQKQPARLSINFEELRDQIEAHVAEYNVVVTADSVGDAKKVATDLNKQAKELDDKRKAAIAEVSAPIKEADEQMKELVGLYKAGRQKILDQVEKFEDETRAEADRKLAEYREKLWEDAGVEPGFRKAEYADLVKLTALTAKGNLAAAVTRELDSRVRDDKALQDRTEKRLMELENRSYKAGLKEPLTRDHVAHFLMADDDEYEAGIDRILKAEVERQERIEAAERERAECERQKVEAERELEARKNDQASENEQARAAGEEPAQPAPEPTKAAPEPPAPAPDGKRAWNVYCTFRLECSARISKEQIEGELRRVLEEKAGITTLESVEAVGQEKAA